MGPTEQPGVEVAPEMGVGGPIEMQSPYKNYKNPQDYKVFNFGNEPTPFDAKRKSRAKRY